jgi:hypothetical protein
MKLFRSRGVSFRYYRLLAYGHIFYTYSVIIPLILSRVGVAIDGVQIGRMDFLTTYTHDLELQAITAPLIVCTIHKSPQHPLSISQPAVS